MNLKQLQHVSSDMERKWSTVKPSPIHVAKETYYVVVSLTRVNNLTNLTFLNLPQTERIRNIHTNEKSVLSILLRGE